MCDDKKEYVVVNKNELIKYIKATIDVAYDCENSNKKDRLKESINYLPLVWVEYE